MKIQWLWAALLAIAAGLGMALPASAQSPLFVTRNGYYQEPGSPSDAAGPTAAQPRVVEEANSATTDAPAQEAVEEEAAEVSAYAATTTTIPTEQPKLAAATATPSEQPKPATEKPAAELKKPFIHYNISQLKLIGNDKSIAPIEPEFSAAVILEMKHLSFHPVSKGEVKEVEIKAPSSAASAASSPKGKCFFTSCFR